MNKSNKIIIILLAISLIVLSGCTTTGNASEVAFKSLKAPAPDEGAITADPMFATLEVIVKSNYGTNIEGVTVKVTNSQRGYDRTAQTDSTGRASFRIGFSGTYNIEASKDSPSTSTTVSIRIADVTERKNVIKNITLEGHFSAMFLTYNSNTDDPISGTAVALYHSPTNQFLQTIDSNSTGGGLFTNLVRDSYYLIAQKEGYENIQTEPFKLYSYNHPHVAYMPMNQLDLNVPGSITAITIDGNTEPIQDANITLYQNGTPITIQTTDTNGTTIFQDILDGYYKLKAEKTGYNTITTNRFYLSPAEHTTKTINMTLTNDTNTSGSITAITIDGNTEPIQDANITLYQNGTPITIQTTDTNGTTIFDGIPSASYYLIAGKPGYNLTTTNTFFLNNGEHTTKTINMVLEGDFNTGAIIEISVEHPTEGRLSSASVTIRHWNGFEYIYMTKTADSNGLAIFSGITDSANYYINSITLSRYALIPFQNPNFGFVSESDIENGNTLSATFNMGHTGLVSFTARDAQTSLPIEDANGTIYWHAGDFNFFIAKDNNQTDSSGYANLGYQLYGQSRLDVVHPNYEDFSVEFTHPLNTLNPANPYSDINVFLTPSDGNAGRVIAPPVPDRTTTTTTPPAQPNFFEAIINIFTSLFGG